MKYIFHLGHSFLHAEAEIRTVLLPKKVSIDAGDREKQLLFVQTDSALDTSLLMHQLGGTTRIGVEVDLDASANAEAVADWLTHVVPDGRIIFAISGVSERFGIQVKKVLKQLGRSARFVVVQNSATILHNNLVTTGIHLEKIGNTYFKTVALHEFEDMASRDYKRPAFDDVSGMLPPKLARLMLNLSGATSKSILLDPFCGSGTVLMEAIDLGLTTLYGTDISKKAIADTKKNIVWLQEELGVAVDAVVKQADAQLLSNAIPGESIDVIVTEPYMGKPKKGNETKTTLEQEVADLRKLYTAALDSFSRVLKPGGIVVFSKPRFRSGINWLEIDWSSALAQFGFDVIPLLPDQVAPVYARASHHVGREIWRLQKR